MSEPREWWITFEGDPAKDYEKSKKPVSPVAHLPIFHDQEVVHVIEKSAYDALKAENETYRAIIEEFLEFSRELANDYEHDFIYEKIVDKAQGALGWDDETSEELAKIVYEGE